VRPHGGDAVVEVGGGDVTELAGVRPRKQQRGGSPVPCGGGALGEQPHQRGFVVGKWSLR